jgi:hypothetical protein
MLGKVAYSSRAIVGFPFFMKNQLESLHGSTCDSVSVSVYQPVLCLS